jgi:hypothetical protein
LDLFLKETSLGLAPKDVRIYWIKALATDSLILDNSVFSCLNVFK